MPSSAKSARGARTAALPWRSFVIVAVTAALAACGGAAPSPTLQPTPTPTPAPVTLEFHGKEFAFTPRTADVPQGQAIRIVLVNDGLIEHNLVIDALNVHLTAAPGASAEALIAPPAAGTYQVYCSITGHREAGMTGTLDVK